MDHGLNPLPSAETGRQDLELVLQAQAGNRVALEELIRRHQRWIYNIVLRMVYDTQDAEDVTQEILIKVVTKLSTFTQRSALRTWLYRIAVNHVLNMKRTKAERWEMTFEKYGTGLTQAPDQELPDPHAVPADLRLLVEEAKIGCTSGMLLCLSREQRVAYILGEIFGVTDLVGAELMEIRRDNFRQILARARRDLHQFMHGQCGLVNEANPCRCAKKTQAFINVGYVDPSKLVFASDRLARVRDIAPKAHDRLEALDEAYAEIHRSHPLQDGPDFVAALRRLLGGATLALLCLLMIACRSAGSAKATGLDLVPELTTLERAALDRWIHLDPDGYLALYGDDVTYFDPMNERRVDGLPAMRAALAPIRTLKMPFTQPRYEMLTPKVQRYGDIAILTFNLVNYGRLPNQPESVLARWNSTEVYCRHDNRWQIVHSHWSYIKGQRPQP